MASIDEQLKTFVNSVIVEVLSNEKKWVDRIDNVTSRVPAMNVIEMLLGEWIDRPDDIKAKFPQPDMDVAQFEAILGWMFASKMEMIAVTILFADEHPELVGTKLRGIEEQVSQMLDELAVKPPNKQAGKESLDGND